MHFFFTQLLIVSQVSKSKSQAFRWSSLARRVAVRPLCVTKQKDHPFTEHFSQHLYEHLMIDRRVLINVNTWSYCCSTLKMGFLWYFAILDHFTRTFAALGECQPWVTGWMPGPERWRQSVECSVEMKDGSFLLAFFIDHITLTQMAGSLCQLNCSAVILAMGL